ncbi:unnamed protein product [Macrosiphum euphorbiae]|uniref:DUF4806 domain-containing protein n=1 Tax=Macrosiphum euphorbiae TaxID=13131 RepID=A0AAV0XZE1_9HEMI|nr:unnamed protein product [Macrosiphum euphorbiae]CAI6374047.1 unnamed protein product [Macrosiphum euphorbiae]
MVMLNDMQEKQNKLSTDQSIATSSSHEFKQIYETLSVSNEVSLNNLQQALTNNSTLCDKTVKMLSLIGGGDVKESLRCILRKLLSNEYAKTFSYTGHKHSKTAFN